MILAKIKISRFLFGINDFELRINLIKIFIFEKKEIFLILNTYCFKLEIMRLQKKLRTKNRRQAPFKLAHTLTHCRDHFLPQKIVYMFY